MPRRNDIHRIMIIGSGPIIIGQACEFDYSGTQACKALRADGYEVVLVNSNPATIMTDPDLADRTYVEPLHRDYLENNLLKAGAILFRGFGLKSSVDFEKVAQGIYTELFGDYGDLPREVGRRATTGPPVRVS